MPIRDKKKLAEYRERSYAKAKEIRRLQREAIDRLEAELGLGIRD